MKQILIFLFAFIAFNAKAQFGQGEARIETPDTAAGSATHYIYFGGGTSAATALEFKKNYVVNATLQFDSLSGNPNGLATFQVCDDPTGTNWYSTATTLTLNGVTGTAHYEDTDMGDAKLRVKIVNQSTTQSDRCSLSWTVKPKNN